MSYRAELSRELVKLADLMETCDYGDEYYQEYEKEYKYIFKKLYPNR